MGCSLSKSDLSESWRAHSIGDLLNLHLPPVIRPFIRVTLQGHLNTLQGPDGLLISSSGEKLRFDPDNILPPPGGIGVQLSFKSLPHHNTRANTPVVVHNVDELALLYCREFVKTKCLTIGTADSSSLLNMLAKASCFPPPIREAATRVRDEVRNLWAHGNYHIWTRDNFIASLNILVKLVILIPNNKRFIKQIDDIMKKA